MTERTKRLKRANRLYRAFHEQPPREHEIIRLNNDVQLVAIGECTRISYLTPENVEYMHKFKKKSRPMLAVSDDGKQLYLVKGKYRFTDRGIEDR